MIEAETGIFSQVEKPFDYYKFSIECNFVKLKLNFNLNLNRRPRNSCLPGCTDVLLLGRGHHPTDECPCHCEQCSKPSGVPDPKEAPCCRPECCPESQALQFTQPPCGCECELQARRELGRVIRTQNDRIRELEALLCRQNNMRTCLQRKLDELYCEFGRLDEAEADANRSRLTCPGSDRGAPDCASVTEPPPRYEGPRVSHSRSHSSRKSVVLEPMPLPPKKPPKEPKEEELLPPPGERVHWLSQQSPESAKCTQRPRWVNEAEDDADTMSTLRSKISFKFAEISRMGPPPMPRSNDSNPSYTSSYTSASYSNTNSSYSTINRSKSNDSRSNRSRAWCAACLLPIHFQFHFHFIHIHIHVHLPLSVYLVSCAIMQIKIYTLSGSVQMFLTQIFCRHATFM